jgi:hypothetical protein
MGERNMKRRRKGRKCKKKKDEMGKKNGRIEKDQM